MLKLSIALVALLSGSSVQVSSSPMFGGTGNLFNPLGFNAFNLNNGNLPNPFNIINGVNSQLSSMFNNPGTGFVGGGVAVSSGGFPGTGGFVGGGSTVSSGGFPGTGGFVGGGSTVSSGGFPGTGGFVGGGSSIISSSGPSGGIVGGSSTFSGGALGRGGVTTSTVTLYTNTGERYYQEISEWHDGDFLRRDIRTVWPSKGKADVRRYRVDLRKPNAEAVEISD